MACGRANTKVDLARLGLELLWTCGKKGFGVVLKLLRSPYFGRKTTDGTRF